MSIPINQILALAQKFKEEIADNPYNPYESPYEDDPYEYDPYEEYWDTKSEYEDPVYPFAGHNYYLVIESIDGNNLIHSGWKNQEAANKAKRQLINERKIKGAIKVVPREQISYRPYRLNPEHNDSWLHGYKDYRYSLEEDEDWIDPQDEKMGKASFVQLNNLVTLSEKFLSLVKAEHDYDPGCQCPNCIETELHIKNQIKKEKSGPKHPKPKHTKN